MVVTSGENITKRFACARCKPKCSANYMDCCVQAPGSFTAAPCTSVDCPNCRS